MNPDNIRNIIKQSEANKSGIYEVDLFIRAKKVTIVIDDLIFKINDLDCPDFARNSALSPSLWGPLLEKAWAKLVGDYNRLNGGYPA
mmetsp:Transcript_5087/g.7732  ORF Transcript_5087/g.7732 Transcript_5087/m.7732 type:complete len:87 (+) Transcript_5087:499-759(+)